MFNSSFHGWSRFFEAVSATATSKDGDLQQPRRHHPQKQAAVSHLQNRGSAG